MHRTRHPRIRTACATLAVAALAMAGTGCSGEDDAPSAADAWTSAQTQLREAGSGSFSFMLEAAGQPLIHSEGSFRLDPAASVWSTVTVDEEGARTDEFALDASRFVARLEGADKDCWTPREKPADDAVVPGPVRLLLDATDPAWDGDAVGSVLQVDAHLDGVLDALGQLTEGVELAPDADARVSVDVMLEKGRVSAWATDLREVLTAAKDGGGTVPAALEPFMGEDSDFPVLASLTGLGAEVDVTGPTSDDLCR